MGPNSHTRTLSEDSASRLTTYPESANASSSLGVDDPANPFNNNAQANSWTPPLNTSWTWGKDRVYGVNLGGWLVMEPFIRPDIYQRYPGAVDEFTLSTLMAADTANGGLAQLETHYDTFVVSV
jgi:glucan 1,3-beta-glucosidase